MDSNYMDIRASLNIVDHYYYPDSDLETIQEESSVLESDDDRSLHQEFWRSVDAATNASRFVYDSDATYRTSDSDLSHSSMSGASTPRMHQEKSPSSRDTHLSNFTNADVKNDSSVNGYHTSSSYISYNGHDADETIIHGAVDPLSQQKIVYAKCLTPKKQAEVSKPPFIDHNQSKEPPATITDMFQAAREGSLSALESFSSNELSDTVDESGNTTLHVAAEHGHITCVKKLVSNLSPQMVTLPNDELITPTAAAVKNGHFGCVQWLVNNTAARSELTISQRPSSIDGASTRPPLAHVAAMFNRNEILDWICEEMLKDNIAIDTADHCSNTAVHVGARYGHLRCIQTLVAKGASVTVLNSDGDTPGQAAQKHGHDSTVGYLVVVETCVSLAQQLVALRNDMDVLVKCVTPDCKSVLFTSAGVDSILKAENEKLRNDVVAKRSSLSKSELEAKCSNDSALTNKPKAVESTKREVPPGISTDNETVQQKRKPLQQQPPPPKLWSSKMHNDSKKSEKVISSVKGHVAVPVHKTKASLDNDSLQRKINAALNGPGTTVDSSTSALRVTAIEHNESKSNEVKSTVNTMKSRSKDLNNEVETLTKDIIEPAQQKPWEKLTMDEMLRMVRDIRYQPSPSISLCTEDSTMEPVEVMKERMAAASRWFLVEKGRETKPKNLPLPATPRNITNHDRRGAGDFHAPKNAPRVKNEPLRATTQLSAMTHQQSSTKMQSAIHHHYRRNATEATSPKPQHKSDDSTKNTKVKTPNDVKSFTPSNVQKSNVASTGTLKFMVSNASFPGHPKSKSSHKHANQSFEAKSSGGNSNSVSPKASSPHTSEGTPPSTPIGSSTQRSNSYRRAVQLRHQNEDASSSSDTPSSSNASNGSSSHDSSNEAHFGYVNEPQRQTKANWPEQDKTGKQKRTYDPLQKRTGKETNMSPAYSQPRVISSVQNGPLVPGTKSNSTNKFEKSKKNIRDTALPNTRSGNPPHKFFNTWSVPRNNKGLDSLKGLNSIQHNYDDDDDDEVRNLSEVPEIKTEIPTRQTSFLRKVQGKLK